MLDILGFRKRLYESFRIINSYAVSPPQGCNKALSVDVQD